jgi:carboxypeptidase D
LLIGNGWISPPDHYEGYLKMAYSAGLIEKGSEVAKRLEMQHRICQKQLAVSPGKVDLSECEAILSSLLAETTVMGLDGKRKCVNMYDVRLKDSYPSCGMNWPPDLVNITPYLRRPDVLEALHVDPNKNTGWTECNGAVGAAFRAPNSKPSIEFLPKLVEEVPVLLFSGDQDLICNHFGTESLISNMEWNGAKGFEISPGTWAPRRYWTFEGEPAGFWQEARNLTYVLFYNSSHMVPFDYPRRTRDMLDRFIGVDISSIGGTPTDSRLDGEKGPETTVGGAAGNGTAAQEAEKAKLDAAKWQAYRKSGELVLVIVIIAAGAWGWYVWRDRRKRRGYQGLAGGDAGGSTDRIPIGERIRGGANRGLENLRNKRGGNANRDVEAADFDENELDDLHVVTPTVGAHDERYSVGEESDDGEDAEHGKEKSASNGKASEAQK